MLAALGAANYHAGVPHGHMTLCHLHQAGRAGWTRRGKDIPEPWLEAQMGKFPNPELSGKRGVPGSGGSGGSMMEGPHAFLLPEVAWPQPPMLPAAGVSLPVLSQPSFSALQRTSRRC